MNTILSVCGPESGGCQKTEIAMSVEAEQKAVPAGAAQETEASAGAVADALEGAYGVHRGQRRRKNYGNQGG